MSLTHVRSQFSRKTLAIALAVGVTLGSVQVVGPDMGLNTVAEASAAELDSSVVTKTELVSDKSGKNVLGTTVEATQEAYDNFFNTHGENYILKLDFKIPDSAQPGDMFKIRAFGPGDFSIQGVIEVSTSEGRKVGSLDVGNWLATFTVSNEVENARDRTVSFEVPFRISNLIHNKKRSGQAQDGKPASSYFVKFNSKPESFVEFKQVYQYVELYQKAYSWEEDKPNYRRSFEDVNVNVGSAVMNPASSIGHADTFLQDKGTDASGYAYYDNVYKLDASAKTNRDVTIRYVIDDTAGRIVPTPETQVMWVSEFSPTGFEDKNGRTPANKDSTGVYFYKYVDGQSYKVTYNQVDQQTLEVTVHDVPPNHNVSLDRFARAESPYSPGKKVTLTSTFVNGVGEPHYAYNSNYIETQTVIYTHPTFVGYGFADSIKREADMSAKVNGQEADNISSAEQVKGGKAKFSIDVKNNGNIGAGSVTVKYPKGVTGLKGETEKFIDFGRDGFPANSTKTLDLGELNVPEGINANEFTVVMTGYPELKDAAWTATGPTDIYVSDVKKDGDGNYVVTRNDGKKWTINLKDIRDKITALENKKTVSPEDLKKVKDELVEVKNGIDGLKGKDAETDKAIQGLRDDLNKLEPRVDKLEDRVTKLEKITIKEVKDNGDGTYTLIREDGSKVKGAIGTGGSITGIKDNGNGSITVTHADGTTEKVILSQTKVVEDKKKNTVTITTPDGKKVVINTFDTFITNVEKQDNGDYLVTRNDGKKWTINLKDIRDKITALENKKTVSPEDLKKVQDELDTVKNGIDGLNGKDAEINKALDGLRKDLKKLEPRVKNLENRVTKLEKTVIKEVKDNGDGTYTLIREDGSKVKGAIGTGGSITGIKDNGNGSITMTHADGTTEKVILSQTKVVEDKKKNTVTITTPDGKKVVLNTFDTFITNVEKQDNGDYLVTRNDGETWTINLKDLRDKISDLEKNKADKTQVEDLKKELDALNKDVADNFDQATGDAKELEKDLENLGSRVTTLETKVTNLENKQITKIKNDKGTYTLIREDGSVVEGVIDASGNVSTITDNGDGSIIITHIDGSTEKVNLSHTTVVEDKDANTVTITTPDGKKVVLNTFDTFITNVEKQDNGDYLVTRNDGETWTITTSELYNQIDGLDAQLAETIKNLENLKETAASKEEVAKLQQELEKHTAELENHENRLKELEANGATKDDIAAVEKEIADNKAVIEDLSGKLDDVTSRVDVLEKDVDTNTSDIEKLKTDLGDVTTQVEKNVTNINSNATEIAGLREKVVDNTAEITDLKEKVVTKQQLSEVVRQVDNHQKRIAELENKGVDKTELEKTQEELAQLERELAELENKAQTKADAEKLAVEIVDHTEKIASLEKETSELKTQLRELTTVVTERFEKVTERITTLETRTDETDKSLEFLDKRVSTTEIDIQQVKVDILSLGDRIDVIEVMIANLSKRVESLESDVKALQESNKQLQKSNECYATMSRVGLITALVGPLVAIAASDGTGSQANVDIQKQLGIFNPELAKMMADNQGIIKALSAVAALAAGLGILGYVSDKCGGVENIVNPGSNKEVIVKR